MHGEIRERHKPLFSAIAAKLGETLRILNDASNELEEKSHHRTEGSLFAKTTPTPLGEQVGKDEIHWWVFKNGSDLTELRNRSETALNAVQTLKVDSATLAKLLPDSYEKLISVLANFINAHSAEIESLRQYVCWLSEKDALAPTILYTYRVWGSTRRAERSVPFASAISSSQVSIDRWRYVEVDCGLFLYNMYTLERVEMEIGGEIAESIDPESAPYDQPIEVPHNRLIQQTSHESLHAFAEYFEMIRDSLRNVILDIEKYDTQRDLLRSVHFWAGFIDKVRGLIEHQQWDFKEVLNMWRIPRGKEQAKNEAELKFAELVAGFANAQGGVLLVGITDHIPRAVKGIGDDHGVIEQWLKYTRDVISQYVNYPRDIVHLQLTAAQDDRGISKNCLVVVIAQASEAVAVKDTQNRFTYPVRNETGLSRVDRSQVASKKIHLKADSFDFLEHFNQILRKG